MYTRESLTHRYATLLIDGGIVSGSIFNGSTFVAGTWLGFAGSSPKFDLERRHPVTHSRVDAFTFDVTDRPFDVVDDGFGMVQHVYRVSRQELV